MAGGALSYCWLCSAAWHLCLRTSHYVAQPSATRYLVYYTSSLKHAMLCHALMPVWSHSSRRLAAPSAAAAA